MWIKYKEKNGMKIVVWGINFRCKMVFERRTNEYDR